MFRSFEMIFAFDNKTRIAANNFNRPFINDKEANF